jgi:agmatinase
MFPLQNRLFADAGAGFSGAQYVILGVPFDATTSFRPGTRMGPGAIRDASYNFESYIPEFGIDLSDIPIHDCGDLDTPVTPEGMVVQVEEAVRSIVSHGKTPVLLGGEHSVSIGAARAARPGALVVCDAHLDLRDEFRGERFSHGCATRRIHEQGVDRVVILGARSGTRDQYEYARHLSLYDAETVRLRGIGDVIREISGLVAGKRLYLSIDADVIDCCLTPGLGTPEPFGLDPLEIRAVIRALAPLASAFDYVEVNPCDNGQTAAVAAQMVREFIAAHYSGSLRP